MGVLVSMDLNELNRMLGVAWQKGDEEKVVLIVFPAGNVPAGCPGAESDVIAAVHCPPDGPSCYSKGRVTGYTQRVQISFRLGDLRDVLRKACALALHDPHGLRAFEPVALTFGRLIVTVHCKGAEWRVRGVPFRFPRDER
jgi:hypothetical protein